MSVKLHKTVLKRITDKILVKITRHREFRRQWIWQTFTPTQLLFITSLSIPVLWHYYVRVPESYRHVEVWANLPLLNPRTPDLTFPERWKDHELGLEIETRDTHTFIHKIITANLLVEPVDFYAPLSPDASHAQVTPVIETPEATEIPDDQEFPEEELPFEPEPKTVVIAIGEEEKPSSVVSQLEQQEPEIVTQLEEKETASSPSPALSTPSAEETEQRRAKEEKRLREKLTEKARKKLEKEYRTRKQTQSAPPAKELTDTENTYLVFNQIHQRLAHKAAVKNTLKKAFDSLKSKVVVEPGLHATTNDREHLVKIAQTSTPVSPSEKYGPTLEDLVRITKEWEETKQARLREAEKRYRKSIREHLADYIRSWTYVEAEHRTRPQFFIDPETGLPKIRDSHKSRTERPANLQLLEQPEDAKRYEQFKSVVETHAQFDKQRGEEISKIPAIPEAAEKGPFIEFKAKSILARATVVQNRVQEEAVIAYRTKLQGLKQNKQEHRFLYDFYLPLVTQDVYLDWKNLAENPKDSWTEWLRKEPKRIRAKFYYNLLRWIYRDEVLLEYVKTLESFLELPHVQPKSLLSLERQPFQFFQDLSISPTKWDTRIFDEITARSLAQTALRKEWSETKKRLETRIFGKAQKVEKLRTTREVLTKYQQAIENYATEFFSSLSQTKELQEAEKHVETTFAKTLHQLGDAWGRQRHHVRETVTERERLWETRPHDYQSLKEEFVKTLNQLEETWKQALLDAGELNRQVTEAKYERRYTAGTKLSKWFDETRAFLYETVHHFISLSLQVFATTKQQLATQWHLARENAGEARLIEVAGYFALAERRQLAQEEFRAVWLDTFLLKDFVDAVCAVHTLVTAEAANWKTKRDDSTLIRWDKKNSQDQTYFTGEWGRSPFDDPYLSHYENQKIRNLAEQKFRARREKGFTHFSDQSSPDRDWEKWVSLRAKNRLLWENYQQKTRALNGKKNPEVWQPAPDSSLWKIQSKWVVAYGKLWVKILNWYFREDQFTYASEAARKEVFEGEKRSGVGQGISGVTFRILGRVVKLLPIGRTPGEVTSGIAVVNQAIAGGTIVFPEQFLSRPNLRRTYVNRGIRALKKLARDFGVRFIRGGGVKTATNLAASLHYARSYNLPIWLRNKEKWEAEEYKLLKNALLKGRVGKLEYEASIVRATDTKQAIQKAITTLQKCSPFDTKKWTAEEQKRYEQARQQIWTDYFNSEKSGLRTKKADQKRREERVARLEACDQEHEEWRTALRKGPLAYLKKKVESKRILPTLDSVFIHLDSLFTKLQNFLTGAPASGNPPRARILPRNWNLATTSLTNDDSPESSQVSAISSPPLGLTFTTLVRNEETPESEAQKETPTVVEAPEEGRLTRAKTQFARAVYQKVEVGESPARWNRRALKPTTRWDKEKDEPVVEIRPGPSLYYPTPARRTVDIVEGINGRRFTLRTQGRWRETYAALANQVLQERDLIWEPIRPWAKVEPDTVPPIPAIALPEIPLPSDTSRSRRTRSANEINGRELHLTPDEEQDLEVWATRAKELYDQPLISLPYQHLETIPEPGRKSSPIRSERFVGPLKGPRVVPAGLHSVRVLVDIKTGAQDLDLQDYPLLWDEENQPDQGHEYYDNVTDTLEEDAEERDAEGFFEKLRTLRFRPWRLFSDRPYRAIRLANRALGERSRPRLAAAERPFRRRDPVSRSVQAVVNNSLGGLPEDGEGYVNTVLLPSKAQAAESLLPENKRVQPWAHYRLGNDLSVAQARRRWWREWHNYDPDLFEDQRRAGTATNERIGRQNLGWWRSLLPTELHAPFEATGEGVPGDEREFERRVNYSIDPKAEERAGARQQWHWSQHRYVTLGWLSRLKDLGPVRNEEELDTEFEVGETEEEEEFKFAAYRGVASWKWERLPYTPWTVIFLYWAYRYRKYGYDRFYDDFLKVRAKFLFEGGGVRELDPQWTHWLLEVLGINRSGAAIQIFKPGKRKFKKQLAGLRRELPLLEEWFVHLRYCRRVWSLPKYNPRPSLLVGLPGTGKTSVIRTLADECEVPVIYQCVASFTDAPPIFTQFGYGKTTAPRAVSRGFEAARNAAPAIFFLDEIDRRGKNRGAVLEDPHPEQSARVLTPASDDQVLGLSQLLVEVDSTRKNKGLILVAATNRPEELDPALVRAGRFDRTIVVDLPNRGKRRAILKFYAGRLGWSPSLDWEYVVARTIGYTPARLASLTNTAAILAINAGIQEHTQECFEEAIERLHAPDTTLRGQLWNNPYVRLREAYYQAARGLISWVLHGKDGLQWLRLGDVPPHVPRDGFYRRIDRRHQLQVLRGGRAGERFLVNEVFGTEALDSSRSKPEVLQARRLARRRNYERDFDLGYWRRFPKLGVPQDAQFYRDPALGEYRREKILKDKKFKAIKSKFLKEKIDPFRTKEQLLEFNQPPFEELRNSEEYERLEANEKWYKDWTRFEIQEYWTPRWPLWLPPERHRRTKRVRPNITYFVTVQQRKLLYEALQRNLWILTDYRAELDVVAAQLVIGTTVTQKKVRELLPDLRDKVQKRWEKEQGVEFIIETESQDLVDEVRYTSQPSTAITTEPTKIPEEDIEDEGGSSPEPDTKTPDEKTEETEQRDEQTKEDSNSDDEFDETRGDLQK